MCLCRYGDVDIHKKYLDFCHLHALLCPGNAEVWLKVILIGEIALPLPQEQKIQLLMVFLFIITEPFFFH